MHVCYVIFKKKQIDQEILLHYRIQLSKKGGQLENLFAKLGTKAATSQLESVCVRVFGD